MACNRLINPGFTLVEVLIASVLVILITGGLWSGISFSGTTTRNSMLQSDALNASDSTFRKLKMFLAACEKIDFPVADASSEYSIVSDSVGKRWVLMLAENKRAIIVSSVDGEKAYRFFSSDQSLIKIMELDFHNLGGKELKVTIKMGNVNDAQLKGLSSFASVFKVGL